MKIDTGIIREEIGLCALKHIIVNMISDNGRLLATGSVAIWDNSKVTSGKGSLGKYEVSFHNYNSEKRNVLKFTSKEKAYAYAMKKFIELTTVREK